MKQNLILWFSAIIIVFVISYYKTITGPYYPVSGSFGIEGEKVTFKFDKLTRSAEGYEVLIRTDKEGITGHIEWKEEKGEWERSNLRRGEGILKGYIPKHSAFKKIYYRATVIYKENSFTIPRNEPVVLEFRNRISPAADSMFYFFFFAGLLMAVRTGLEYFRNNNKVKAFSIFTLIFFTLFAFIFSPLRNSYEYGFMSDYIPSPGELFMLKYILYFIIWVAGFILLFIFRHKIIMTAASAAIIIYFLLTGY